MMTRRSFPSISKKTFWPTLTRWILGVSADTRGPAAANATRTNASGARSVLAAMTAMISGAKSSAIKTAIGPRGCGGPSFRAAAAAVAGVAAIIAAVIAAAGGLTAEPIVEQPLQPA